MELGWHGFLEEPRGRSCLVGQANLVGGDQTRVRLTYCGGSSMVRL